MQNCLSVRGEGRVREAGASHSGPVFQQLTSAALLVNRARTLNVLERQRIFQLYRQILLNPSFTSLYVVAWKARLACAALCS